ELLTERTGILNAYYLPADSRSKLYPSITPVNTFRLIFDSCFGTHYGLLPDRVHFSTYEDRFRFVDVTETTAK
ncbi:hypothetical protein MUP00_00870, partial [Candidatus Bathyarchaeota archaeon]|nr:hypothetical protein [Candidatus Bathyarchaeota archaeon]